MFPLQIQISLPSCPQDKLLDMGLKGARLLLWLRAPLPPPSDDCKLGWEEPGTPCIDPTQIVLDSLVAGLCIGPENPQELVASRVAVRHLTVLQVARPHPYLGQQLLGLPIDIVLYPRKYPYLSECFLDLLLMDPVPS